MRLNAKNKEKLGSFLQCGTLKTFVINKEYSEKKTVFVTIFSLGLSPMDSNLSLGLSPMDSNLRPLKKEKFFYCKKGPP